MQQELLGHDSKACPAEENVEAICQFFNTIGKQLDESPKSRRINDMYFSRLKDLTSNPQLAPRLRFMVRDILDLRTNNWIPRREEVNTQIKFLEFIYWTIGYDRCVGCFRYLRVLMLYPVIQVKAKTITEIHSEAEKNLGLRPGATASMRNNRGIISGAQGIPSPGGFPIARPGSGGKMPGMPGTRNMPGMPGMDSDNWEVPRSRSMPRGVQSPLIGKSAVNSRLLPQGNSNLVGGGSSALVHGAGNPSRPSNFVSGIEPAARVPAPVKPVIADTEPSSAEKPVAAASKLSLEDLRRKTVSLLEEYFSVLLLDEALQCVQELQSPDYYPEVVKEAISLALEKSPPRVEPVSKLLEFLFDKKEFSAKDIGTGCLLYASMLDDVGIDLPKAPTGFGEIIGKLVLAGGLDFSVVREVLKKVEDDMFQKSILDGAMRIINSSPSGETVLSAQASDIEACQKLMLQ